jgi:light-regulated signal transduction histidine kinase (bacteriophytochrome)
MARVNAHLRLRALQTQLESQNAQLASTNEALQAFSYSVSHDLRTPLRAIESFAHILVEGHRDELSADGRHCLDQIIANSKRMGSLIETLLQYARTGRAAVTTEPVPLAPIVQQLASLFGERIKATGTRFEVVRPLATPLGDTLLIGQILSNLVDNALTYRCPERAPEVRLSAVRDGGQVVLSVADNGIGIEPEYHDKIFQVFQRLHGPDEYPGSGIGLAIVAKSARLMDGEVHVESELGRGSTFTVWLPAAGG